jgi:D-alanine--poly(phosphoribitol) ligase subunit 2
MDEIREFLSDEIENLVFYRVAAEEALVSTKLLDSIALVDLAVAIEQKYGIKIPFNEINEENFDQINLIAAFIERKMAPKNPL